MSRGRYRDQEPSYTPTEGEIAARCQAIQSCWTRREERARRSWSITPAVAVVQIQDFPILKNHKQLE